MSFHGAHMVISSLILPWLLRRRGWVHGQFIPNVAQSLKLIYFCLASPAAFVKLPIVPARAATKPPYTHGTRRNNRKFFFFVFHFYFELRCKLRVSRFFSRPFPAATAAASSCVIEWSLRFDIRSGRCRSCCCVIMFEHDIHDWQFTYSQQLVDETSCANVWATCGDFSLVCTLTYCWTLLCRSTVISPAKVGWQWRLNRIIISNSCLVGVCHG